LPLTPSYTKRTNALPHWASVEQYGQPLPHVKGKLEKMLNQLQIHGFRTLVSTDVAFEPFTIMLGKNGVGKTSILDVVQLLGHFARNGVERAFGPPPWSLGWQRTKGIGTVATMNFDLRITSQNGQEYLYSLKLSEYKDVPEVKEERLVRPGDKTVVTAMDFRYPPTSGTILHPDGTPSTEIQAVASTITSFACYELNPSLIERGVEPRTVARLGRDGHGVAGVLANMKDDQPERFAKLEQCLKSFRPETESIRLWGSDQIYWGLLDKGQKFPFPAVHLSWGDRQLVGLLCVLFTIRPGSTIALEEIDRGFHPARYAQIIDLLVRAVYEGLFNDEKAQIIVTTHSPSFVNKLADYKKNVRIVTRAAGGATQVRPLEDVMKSKLGTTSTDSQPLGDIWEMGLLEDTINDALT
jgi:AAA domain, putative AbiEii toxin, Type IV TA system